MKKLFIVLTVLTMCLGAQAQLRTSRTTFTTQKPEKVKMLTEWYVRAGLSIDKYTGLELINYDHDISSSSKTGFAVDFGFNKFFTESNKMYWGMELGIGTDGSKFNIGDEYKITQYNVNFSPMLGYRIRLTDNISIDPHIGLYASYNFTSSVTGDDDDDSELEDAEYPDFGMQIGLGLWFNRFNIDFMPRFSFIGHEIDVYTHGWGREKVIDGKTFNFRIRLGYRF